MPSATPVLKILIRLLFVPSAFTPKSVPVINAIIIPVMAPPAINPELNKAPGPTSESSLVLDFLSTKYFTNPPIKIGEVLDKGKYTPTANASELIPHNSTTAEIAIPAITNPQGKSWLNNPFITVDINNACGAGKGWGCSGVAIPIPNVLLSNNNVKPIAITETETPMINPNCCFIG